MLNSLKIRYIKNLIKNSTVSYKLFEDRKHKELDQSLTTLTKLSNDQQHSEPDQGYSAPQIEEIRVLFQSLDL